MPRLFGLEGPASGKELDFDRVVMIGRGEGCQFHIGDPMLSRQHAVVHFDGTRAVLRDCDSTNGTWYGDHEIDCIELKEGDTFRIGRSVLRVEFERVGVPPGDGGKEARGARGARHHTWWR